MKNDIYDKLFALNEAKSLQELEQIFERIINSYGFDQFGVQYTPPENKFKLVKPYSLATYKREWVDYYIDRDYHTIDPVILLGSKQRKPFFWDSLWAGVEMSKKQKDFFNEASDHGVEFGIGLPIPLMNTDPCVVTFMSSFCNNKEVRAIMNERHLELTLIASHFQFVVSKFFEKMKPPDAPNLTRREAECLTWAAAGKSDYEIGAILNISHRTVNSHMLSAYRKLECVSREQAVIKAVILNLISI